MSVSYPQDEKRFDPWLTMFDKAVSAVLSTEHRPPDDPPAKARLVAK